MKSVLCCRTLSRQPMLIITASDGDQSTFIFSYDVYKKQHVEITSKTPIPYDIAQSSITRDPFNVVCEIKNSYVTMCFNV
jgi:hypothetical protein